MYGASRLKWIPLLVFCFGLFQQLAARQKADSLRKILPTLSEPVTKVNVLIELGEDLYQSGKRNEALPYVREAYVLSDQNNYLVGKGNALLVIGHIQLTQNAYDSALLYFNQAESNFLEPPYTRGLIRAYTYMGQTYDVLAKYNMAIQVLRKAQNLAEKEPQPDNNRLGNIHNSLGVTHLNRGSYELAIDHSYKALHYAEQSGNKRLQAGILNNLGVVSTRVENYKQALVNFQKLLELSRELDTAPLVGLALSNVGDCYAHLGEFEKAEQFLNEAIETRTKLNDKRGLAYTLSNKGFLRKQQKQFHESREIYQAAIDMARTFDENELLLSPLIGLASTDIQLKNLGEANGLLQEGRKRAISIGSELWVRDILLLSSQLDSARGDYRSAYQWYKKYKALDDSLFTERKSLQVEEMKALYESEKKDKEIRLLNEVKIREEIERKSDQRLYIISAVVFSLLLVLLIYWLKRKMQTEKILKQQKQEVSDANEEMRTLIEKIEQQNESLEIKNEKLEDLHREKDGMIGIVAHDLRSPLNKVAGLAELITLTGELNVEQKSMVSRIRKVCEDGNGLIRDLMELHQIEDETDVDEIATFEVKSSLKNWMDNYTSLLNNKRLNLQVDLESDKPLTVRGNLSCMTRVLDNLLTNAIKFSPAGKNIFFVLRSDQDKISIVIRDEGPGFKPQDMPHLFKKFKKLSARPTGGEHSTGLGLSIVKALVEKLKGEIVVQSFPDEGATFVVNFPLVLVNDK